VVRVSVNAWAELPTLAPGDVHLWWASLAVSASDVARFLQLLSLDERERAGRFLRDEHRENFLVGRGVLRTILSRYLTEEAGDLRFCYSRWGKPRLHERHGDASLRFNLSHTHGLALYAITRGREIGVDLEWSGAGRDGEEIARTYFSSEELAELSSAPGGDRSEVFLALWTRKEALLKANGAGPGGASGCRVRRLEAPPGYIAALAL